MIADLEPYPEYKESGLPWLGQVPGHWHLRAVRHVTHPAKGKQPKKLYSEHEAPAWAQPYLTMEYLRRHKGPASVYCAPRDGLVTAAAGDVLLLWDGANAGEFLTAKEGVVSSTAALLPTTEHDRRYLYFMLRQCEPRLRALSTGMGIPHVDGGILKQMQICTPPPDEQAAIVRYLDWANGRLERAIRAKLKVIVVLGEQKQATIHRAVTSGLDPSVPLKPSGIPWLGDIPQHWDVRRAKYLFREVDERSREGSEELLSVSHLTGVTPRNQKNITMFKAASYAGHKLCRPGDLVVNTMWAWMGALGVSTYTGIISPAYAVYRPRRPEGIVGTYMDGLLRSRPYVSNIICRSTGLRASRLRLYPEEFLRLPIIQPPQEEQRRIVERVHGDTAELNSAISRLDREIELLREYRTRLVADVVTGKLDVREAAALLPEEALVDTAEEDDAELGEGTEAADEVVTA